MAMLMSLCVCVPLLRAAFRTRQEACPPGRVSLLGVRGQRLPAGRKELFIDGALIHLQAEINLPVLC